MMPKDDTDACSHGVSYDAECAACDADGAEARAAGACTPHEIGLYLKGRKATEDERDMALRMHAVQLERADRLQAELEFSTTNGGVA